MLRGIEIRLYPSPEQTAYVRRLVGTCRFIYNKLTAFGKAQGIETGKVPPLKMQTEYLKSLEKEYPWIREVHSKVRQESRIDYNAAWTKFFRDLQKNGGKPKFKKPKKKKKGKKDKNTQETQAQGTEQKQESTYDKILGVPRFHKKGVKDTCRFNTQAFMGIKGNRISLIRELKDIHFKCSRKDERYLNRHQDLVHSITVRIAPSGRIFASVLVDDLRIKHLPEQQNPKYLGIDVGLKDALTTYDGERFEHIPNPRPLKRHEKLIKRAQRKLAHCTKGSHRYEDVRRLKAKREAKVANIRRNFLQQQSTRLVRENQGIAVEDLNVAGMMKNHKLARSIGDASWSEFVREIEYKCKWYGREFVKIDRFAASSQTCSACGFKNPAVKDLKVREWECPNCHAKHNRDENATVNIRQWGFKEQLGLCSPEVTHVDRSTLGATPAREVV